MLLLLCLELKSNIQFIQVPSSSPAAYGFHGGEHSRVLRQGDPACTVEYSVSGRSYSHALDFNLKIIIREQQGPLVEASEGQFQVG